MIEIKECKGYEKKEKRNAIINKMVKRNPEKERLIELFNYSLLFPETVDNNLPFEIKNVSIINKQKEIVFSVGKNNYSLILKCKEEK